MDMGSLTHIRKLVLNVPGGRHGGSEEAPPIVHLLRDRFRIRIGHGLFGGMNVKYSTWCDHIDAFFQDLSMEVYYDNLNPSDYPKIMDYINQK